MAESPNPRRRQAALVLALTTVFWGLSFPVIKALILMNQALWPGAGAWFVTAGALAPRFVVAAIVMIVLRGRRGGRPTRGEIGQGLGLGLFAAGGTLFQTDGLQRTEASTSAFITQFYAILIPVWFALRRRRNPGAVVWTGCALVLLGVAILGRLDWRTLKLGRGEWETLLSSIFFMGQILWIEKREFAGNRAASTTLVMFAIQAVVFLALAAAVAPRSGSLAAPLGSPAWVCLTLALAAVCTVGAFWLMNEWQPRIPATQAGLIYCIEPVIASIFALFLPSLISGWASVDYPNEHATWSLVVGGGLIMAANIMVQARLRRD
ncbi:MAG TPA: DMT family transporter [Opitutaceae bacterium]|nr:DMT family transporter [Opitutaceae bacterium]